MSLFEDCVWLKWIARAQNEIHVCLNFSHVLPALCSWRHLYALEQMSVSSWLDWTWLPHRYTSGTDVKEVCPASQAGNELWQCNEI